MPPITQLRIEGQNLLPDLYDETLEIHAELTKKVIGDEMGEKASATFELVFDMTDDFIPHWNEIQIINTFVAEMPVSQVRNLAIYLPEEEIAPEQYFDWFSTMEDLAYLEVSQLGGIGLPLALKRTTPYMPIFPELVHLKLANYNFGPSFGSRFVTLLCIALERRARKGFKLPCLQFRDCLFADTDWIPRARACVEMLRLPEDRGIEEYQYFYHVIDRLYDGGCILYCVTCFMRTTAEMYSRRRRRRRYRR